MVAMPLHRRVLFIAGFDPKSPRYYHRLYRRLATHRPPGDHRPAVQVGPRRHLSAWAEEWDVGQPEHGGSRYALLRWDDIVREHWPRSAGTVWRDRWNFYVGGLRQGFFGRAWKASRSNSLFVTLPLLGDLAVLALWFLAAVALVLLTGPWPGWALAAWGLGAVVATAVSAPWLARHTGFDWLMRLYGFSHAQAGGRLGALEARIDAMARLIVHVAEAESEAREILIVGHSTGATLAASAVARALVQAPWLGQRGPQLALLTLGHCIPLVSFFDSAQRLRAELAALANHPALTWADYTAPADWAGCAGIAPWTGSGAANLHRLSPRFPKILTPAHYAALKRNRLQMHMQYLKPPDIGGGYDLLTLTAGERTLRERHPPT
jgi:hypothetical protein